VAKRSSDALPRRTSGALPVDLEDSVELTGALIELAQDADLRERLVSRVHAMDFGGQSWISIAKMIGQACEGALVSPNPSSPFSPHGV